MGGIESKTVREDGDFVYWVKDFRLVLVRDLPSELQPLANELIKRYEVSKRTIGEKIDPIQIIKELNIRTQQPT